eukprot:1416712-Alexandrium_andersonii.AAC.1
MPPPPALVHRADPSLNPWAPKVGQLPPPPPPPPKAPAAPTQPEDRGRWYTPSEQRHMRAQGH